MATDLEIALQVNHRVRAELDKRQAVIDVREASARSELAECAKAREVINHERAALDEAEQVIVRHLGDHAPVSRQPLPLIAQPETDQPPSEASSRSSAADDAGLPAAIVGQKRNRIGLQRYLILALLRYLSGAGYAWCAQSGIAKLTGLSVKRVRDQIRDDLEDGVVGQSEPEAGRDEMFCIMPLGIDLLNRWEEYRKSKGLPVPAHRWLNTDNTKAGIDPPQEAAAA